MALGQDNDPIIKRTIFQQRENRTPSDGVRVIVNTVGLHILKYMQNYQLKLIYL